MHLTPRETERLTIFTAAELARRRLARGAKLGAVEATALVCDEVLEWAWDGLSLAEVISRARSVVAAESLLPGVAAAVPRIEVEALFPYGSTLVHIEAPFGPAGEIVRTPDGEIVLAAGRERRELTVVNRGERPLWISSHFPLDKANSALELDREAAAGCRLDIPAGTSVEFAPGESRTVSVVAR